MLFFRQRDYHPILSDSDLGDAEGLEKSTPSAVPMSRLSKIATFLAITCTIFNLVYLAYMAIPYLLHREPDLASLPRPNQFIGLERINYTKHPFPNVKMATFAGVIAQIDRSRPKYVSPVDPRRRSTYFGTVSPEDRNVLATNQISTVMQFRSRDFGMEWCRLKLALPDSARFDPSDPNNEADRERNWLLEGDTSDLEVWELEASQWIDPRYLSYNTRPRRRGHIFSFRVQPNSTHVSREVRCPADKIATFEIFCVSPGCRVDIWQNKLQPPIGLFLEQRSSL
ncbi:hypothetical protein Hypma_005038 [Hypsizygus marmoreus]|uniref:Ubiquitin 3 binding protein But2 C-terminal domain-containing protein n=1 Tax=Hypsizygus marmoreus TaxID=39966 RepID=A0A369K0F8_HYPMA|nr:hypothetical protein Hypma_005038 [Hypsizygus marmoreus]